VGGLPKETARHIAGLEQSLPAPSVFSVHRADAEHCATVATVDQTAAAIRA